jgi:hypothetical protein
MNMKHESAREQEIRVLGRPITGTIEDPFEAELRRAIKNTIAHLDRGTVGISRDCLWQCTVSRITRECPHAPVGTNCGFVARQVFDSIVSEKSFSNFVYAS